MKTSKFALGLVAAGVTLVLSSTTLAHTVSLGSINAGAPGSVSIWLGSYHTGAPNEGSLTIGGSTVGFDLLSTVLPTGLVDGVNNFYAPNFGGKVGQFDQSIVNARTVTRWQGVTVTGLTAGLQPYTISGMSTVNFSDWNSSKSNWTGTVSIPRSSVSSVPEPTSVTLLALGLLGLGFSRRRQV